MIRRFARDAAAYGFATLLGRGVSLVVVPIYTRSVAPSEYGIVDLVNAISAIVGLTLALEIAQAVGRFHARSSVADQRQYFSTALWFTVGINFAFVALVVWFAPEVAVLFLGSAVHQDLVRIAAVSIGLNEVYQLALAQLRWDLAPKRFAATSIASSILAAAAGISLVAFWHFGAIGILTGQAVGAGAGAAVALVLTRGTWRVQVSLGHLREMLSFSAPLVISGLGVAATLYVDRLAILNFEGLAAVGIFAVGFKTASLITFLVIPAQMAITPLIYRYHEQDGTPNAIADTFHLFVATSLLVWVTLTIFAPEIILVLAGDAYRSATPVVGLLSAALVVSNLYVFAPGLTLLRRTRTIALVNIASGLGLAICCAFLVPLVGIVGAAAADLVLAVLTFAAYVILGQRDYPIPFQWRPVLVGASGSVVAALIAANMTTPFALPSVAARLSIVGGLGIWLIAARLLAPSHLQSLKGLVRLRDVNREQGASMPGVSPGER